MPNYSVCGLDCDTCYGKTEHGCSGCRKVAGKPFWGECELYSCCRGKNAEHCGKCESFPCDTLKEWASSEGTERIDNLRKLADGT